MVMHVRENHLQSLKINISALRRIYDVSTPGLHVIVKIPTIVVNDTGDPDHCDRWWIAGTGQVSVLEYIIVAIAKTVRAPFHKIVWICGVIHSPRLCPLSNVNKNFTRFK